MLNRHILQAKQLIAGMVSATCLRKHSTSRLYWQDNGPLQVAARDIEGQGNAAIQEVRC